MLRHACGFALASKGHDTRALQAYLAIRIFSTLSATPSWHLIASRTSGGNALASADPSLRHTWAIGLQNMSATLQIPIIAGFLSL
jgi:hypothetical protein